MAVAEDEETELLPTEPPPEAPLATPAPQIHVVQQGETLNAIAHQYGLTAAELAEANGITLSSILSLGQELVIPGQSAAPVAAEDVAAPSAPEATLPAEPTAMPLVHVVQQRDTLGALAVRYDVSAEEIAQANGISLTTVLSLGQELVIPGQSVAPVATEPAHIETGEGTPSVQRTAQPTAEPTPTPAPLRHVVAQGDTLGALAVRYGVSAEEIARANGISLTSLLGLGEELIIPGETAEPTPTDVPMPEATLTPEAMPSLTPTLFPIRPRVMPFSYRAPYLLTPTNGSILEGEAHRPVLQWASVGILAADEWYLVSLWTPEGGDVPMETLTKATFWRVPAELYPAGRRNNRFDWQVTVIRELDVAPGRLALSPPSALYGFFWH